MAAVERHLVLPATPAEAWDLLTDPEELARWLGSEVELRPQPGAAGSVIDHDGTRRRLVVDEAEVERRLSWHWAVELDGGDLGEVTHVELVLAPEGEGTRLVVTERALEGAASQAPRASVARSSAAEAWSHRLLHLEALLLLAAAVRG